MERNGIMRSKLPESSRNAPSDPIGTIHSSQWRHWTHPVLNRFHGSAQGIGISSFQETDPIYDAAGLSQQSLNYLDRGLKSTSSVCGSAMNTNWGPVSSNQQSLAIPNNCFPLASYSPLNFSGASHQPSRSMDLSPVPSTSASTMCVDEALASSTCPTIDGRDCLWSSVCIDPNCAESICEDCCHDCVDDCADDCESDCDISPHCDGVDLRKSDYYSCAGPFSELFGDQAAEHFDLDGRLPPLPLDNLQAGDYLDFGPFPGDADPSSQTQHVPDGCFDHHHRANSSWNPVQLDRQHRLAAALENASLEEVSSLAPGCSVGHEMSETIGRDIWPTAGVIESANFTPACPSWEPHDDERSMDATSTMFDKQTTPSAQCQWSDLNGQPCGKVFGIGDDLHEHLRTAHSIKSEVLCRWIGCRVGVHGTSPHQYANSVERHTWGHSGFRPYKCSVCSEGFAAAKLRDEHIASLHLKQKTFSCDMCSHQCTSATNLKRHKDDKHRAGRFQCEFCNRNGKIRVFPRGPNLARHFRKCKCVLAQFPEAINAATGKIDDDWLPQGYKRGHHGMDRAKVIPPNYLPRSGGK